MSKKIKITESQLKMLMEQEQGNNSSELSGTNVPTVEPQMDDKSTDEQGLDTIKSSVGELLGNGFDRDKLKEMITGLIDSYSNNELGTPDQDHDQNLSSDSPSQDMGMTIAENKLRKQIINDFKRYL